jgi:hypothetical protein
VVVVDEHVHREEYAYYLIIDGDEICGYERDLSHDPPVHRHTEGHAEMLDAEPIPFKKFVELAWREISDRAWLQDT